MVKRFSNAISLGGQFWLASMLYTGLGFLILALAPEFPSAMADGNIYNPCPEGQINCGGSCIPNTMICCEDGTSGDAETCVCCTGCADAQCTNQSTIVCEPPTP
jgi:hypothetical protein